jgi:hypothetical protein
MIRQLIDNDRNAILKVRQNNLTNVTHCLTRDENGSINHTKCTGYYLDTFGFGYTVRCLCSCHYGIITTGELTDE